MKFENTQVWGFEHAIRGMRNPKNSWNKSDSKDCRECDEVNCIFGATKCSSNIDKCGNTYLIGPNDMKLMQTLIKGGSEHRKFMRQIFISVDITAALYFWKEADTYKIGTTANSTSTMHKIASAPITIDCFEIDDYNKNLHLIDDVNIGIRVENFIDDLEQLRLLYLHYKDTEKEKAKKYWKELIRWLPESWLQKRTITMNYENVYSIVRQRKAHKLNEWSGMDNPNLSNFIAWAHSLPYAEELIFFGE